MENDPEKNKKSIANHSETQPEKTGSKENQNVILGILIPLPAVLLLFAVADANSRNASGGFLVVASISAAISAIVCGIMIGRRWGKSVEGKIGLSILFTFLLLVFYGVVFFVGCAATFKI